MDKPEIKDKKPFYRDKFPVRTKEERKAWIKEGNKPAWQSKGHRPKGSVKATTKELAKMKIMREHKETYTSIGEKMGFNHQTVKKYLTGDVYLIPEVEKLAAEIRAKEFSDLELLGGKLRSHLHTLVDNGDMKAIETIAGIDRTFQQRRLLEGKSTQIFDIVNYAKMEEELNGILKELKNFNTPIEAVYETIKESNGM